MAGSAEPAPESDIGPRWRAAKRSSDELRQVPTDVQPAREAWGPSGHRWSSDDERRLRRWIEATLRSLPECDDHFRSRQGETISRLDIAALRSFLTRLRDDMRTYVFADRSLLGAMSPEHASSAVRFEETPFWDAWQPLFAAVEPYYRFAEDRDTPTSRRLAPMSLQDRRDMQEASDQIRAALPEFLEEMHAQLEELRGLLDRGG